MGILTHTPAPHATEIYLLRQRPFTQPHHPPHHTVRGGEQSRWNDDFLAILLAQVCNSIAVDGVDARGYHDTVRNAPNDAQARTPSPPVCLPIIAKNSRRVDGLSRKAPSIRLVTMTTPGLWTPRVVMH